MAKILQVICAAFVVVAFTAVGVVGWDLSGKRINSAREAADAARVPVLGKLPMLLDLLAFGFGDLDLHGRSPWGIRVDCSVASDAERPAGSNKVSSAAARPNTAPA